MTASFSLPRLCVTLGTVTLHPARDSLCNKVPLNAGALRSTASECWPFSMGCRYPDIPAHTKSSDFGSKQTCQLNRSINFSGHSSSRNEQAACSSWLRQTPEHPHSRQHQAIRHAQSIHTRQASSTTKRRQVSCRTQEPTHSRHNIIKHFSHGCSWAAQRATASNVSHSSSSVQTCHSHARISTGYVTEQDHP